MSEPLEPLDLLRRRGARAAVATLIGTRGTTPKKEGAKMWVDESGGVLGSVTIGGCVDARVIEEAGRVVGSGEPTVLEMSLGDEDALELGLTCGGVVRVLVEPVDLGARDELARAYEIVRDELAAGRTVVVATTLGERPARVVVREEGDVIGGLGDAGLERVVVEHARSLLGGVDGSHTRSLPSARGTVDVFFDVFAAPPTLAVFGATHVAMPLVTMAKTLGFRTVVVDARDQFATRERFPDADEVLVGMPSDIAARMRFKRSSAVVLVAHDYKYEVPVLHAVLASEAGYIGMLGSRKRGAAVLELLAGDGVAAEALRRVRTPIGLDIGAESAAEIALSILAEVIAARTGRPGTPMRDRALKGERRDATPAPPSASETAGSAR